MKKLIVLLVLIVSNLVSCFNSISCSNKKFLIIFIFSLVSFFHLILNNLYSVLFIKFHSNKNNILITMARMMLIEGH